MNRQNSSSRSHYQSRSFSRATPRCTTASTLRATRSQPNDRATHQETLMLDRRRSHLKSTSQENYALLLRINGQKPQVQTWNYRALGWIPQRRSSCLSTCKVNLKEVNSQIELHRERIEHVLLGYRSVLA